MLSDAAGPFDNMNLQEELDARIKYLEDLGFTSTQEEVVIVALGIAKEIDKMIIERLNHES